MRHARELKKAKAEEVTGGEKIAVFFNLGVQHKCAVLFIFGLLCI
jgi:hypothetical protein